jgi:hypothetical protein
MRPSHADRATQPPKKAATCRRLRAYRDSFEANVRGRSLCPPTRRRGTEPIYSFESTTTVLGDSSGAVKPNADLERR